MPRRVLVQGTSESFDLIEKLAANEKVLQEIVKANPQLIPADDLGFYHDLVVIGRETTLASGYIDLMCLASTGDVVLVEFKTGPQNPDFRHALAQLIDYGSDLWRLSVADFDAVVTRYVGSGHCLPAFKSARDLDGIIGLTGWGLSDSELGSLHARLADVLATGDFTYVVAAQRFTPSMVASVDYLNATTRFGRYVLVEVVNLVGGDLSAFGAQVVARPQARTATTSSGRTNEAEFLSKITAPDYRNAMAEIFDACRSLGIAIVWGSGGSSLRVPSPDRNEPLSIGWTFLEGGQWYSAKHLTLGVDPASLAGTPSLAVAVKRYVAEVAAIAGATKTPGKLDASTFLPAAVAAAKPTIVAVLEQLIRASADESASEHGVLPPSEGPSGE